MKGRRTAVSLVALAIVGLFASTAAGQMNGHNLRGDYGLLSGSQPPPGWLVSLLYVNYDVDTVRDRDGEALPSAGGDITVQGIAPILWWVTDFEILGAHYSTLIVPSWVNNSLDSPLLATDLETGIGFGDLYVQPINLGWHKARFDFVAGLGVFMPTGRYEDGANDNTGLGMWSLELFGGTTCFFDEQKSWHASVLGCYETHSEKEDSDIQVGDILTLEGGVGKSFMQGAVNVGAAYFAQWKITKDDFGDAALNDAAGKHQIFGVGPEVQVPLFATEKVAGLLGVRYLWDFGSESQTEGETLLATFTVTSL